MEGVSLKKAIEISIQNSLNEIGYIVASVHWPRNENSTDQRRNFASKSEVWKYSGKSNRLKYHSLAETLILSLMKQNKRSWP